MLHIIITGAPGCGKGTQSINIAQKYDLIHISTGDILREKVEEHTAIGDLVEKFINKGYLVPDDIVNQEFNLNTMKYKDAKGFLYDGYPRNISQAKYLDKILEANNRKISIVLSMDVEEEELYKRILHRSMKSNRTDDTEEVIKNRIDIYRQQTVPLLNYYDDRKKLFHIDGMAAIDVVFERFSKVIDDYIKKNF